MIYKKINNWASIFSAVLIFGIIITMFYSCSNDTIVTTKKNTQQIKDSSIFDWQFIHFNLWYGINDIYVADTNRIFYAAGSSLFYKDGVLIIIDNGSNFYAESVAGFNENNVYFGGGGVGEHGHRLKKWNGSIMQEIPIPADSNTYWTAIISIFIVNSNDIWLATNSYRIYHFDGAGIKIYYLPSPLSSNSQFYLDKNGLMILFGSWVSSELDIFYTFEFLNDKWEYISIDTLTSTSLRDYYGICGEDVLRAGLNSIYYYSKYRWDFLVNMQDSHPQQFAGSSRSDFLCTGYTTGLPRFKLYYYNGNEWLWQSNFQPPYEVSGNEFFFAKKGNNYYGAFFPFLESSTYLIIGRPKEFNKGRFKNLTILFY